MNKYKQIDRKIKVAYLNGAKNLVLSYTNKPKIKSDEVLVKVKSVGICGSDVFYYKTGGTKRKPITKPFILGHEVSGIIEEKGRNVNNLNIGDRVALEPAVTCGKCFYCKSGRYNLCSSVKYLASPPVDGAFVEYISHKAERTYRLPDDITFDEAALIEPSSVAFYAVMKSGIKTAKSSLILGAGPIGLLVLKIVKMMGSFPICVVDIEEYRLSLAKKMGADLIVNVKEKNIVQTIKDSSYYNEFDVIFECSGVAEAISSSVFLVKKGGHISMVGIFEGTVPLRVKEIIDREITITGNYRFANVFNDVINLMERGLLEVNSLISHTFNLKNINKAFYIADNKLDNCIKIIIRI